MNDPFIHAIVLTALILGSAYIGSRKGAVTMLCWMLGSVFALFASMRFWFLFSHYAMEQVHLYLSQPLKTSLAFFLPFLLLLLLIARVSSVYLKKFAFDLPSIGSRVLGALWGAITGITVFAAVLLVVAPLFPGYFGKETCPSFFSLHVHEVPLHAYRYVERNLAGVNPSDSAHTPLPVLRDQDAEFTVFWQ